MQQAGLSVKKHILDNEASAIYKDAIKTNHVTHELVPPNNHRRNVAERAIQTAKNHIVSVLCGCHDDFPMHLWCRLLPNIEWQINLLRQSNVTPNVSAYAHVHGPHDFLRHPYAPLGCPVQVHVPPANRKSWAKHTESVWHLGTSNEHYRCFREYINKTKSERISDTVFFQHKHLTQPTVFKEDAVIAAAKRLHSTILGQVNPANEHYDRLKNLSDMFNSSQMKRQQKQRRNVHQKSNAGTEHHFQGWTQLHFQQKQRRQIQGWKAVNKHLHSLSSITSCQQFLIMQRDQQPTPDPDGNK